MSNHHHHHHYKNHGSSGHSSGTSSVSSSFNPGESPNYRFKRPREPSPRMRVLLMYIDAVNRRDHVGVGEVMDEALEHRILPKSLERPVLTKRQYVDYFKYLMGMFESFEVKIHEVAEAGDTFTVHGSSRGVSVLGTPYSNEFIIILHFAAQLDDGRMPKIRYVKEFVDSSISAKFFREEREKQRKKKEEEQAART